MRCAGRRKTCATHGWLKGPMGRHCPGRLCAVRRITREESARACQTSRGKNALGASEIANVSARMLLEDVTGTTRLYARSPAQPRRSFLSKQTPQRNACPACGKGWDKPRGFRDIGPAKPGHDRTLRQAVKGKRGNEKEQKEYELGGGRADALAGTGETHQPGGHAATTRQANSAAAGFGRRSKWSFAQRAQEMVTARRRRCGEDRDTAGMGAFPSRQAIPGACIVRGCVPEVVPCRGPEGCTRMTHQRGWAQGAEARVGKKNWPTCRGACHRSGCVLAVVPTGL